MKQNAKRKTLVFVGVVLILIAVLMSGNLLWAKTVIWQMPALFVAAGLVAILAAFSNKTGFKLPILGPITFEDKEHVSIEDFLTEDHYKVMLALINSATGMTYASTVAGKIGRSEGQVTKLLEELRVRGVAARDVRKTELWSITSYGSTVYDRRPFES